MLKRVGLAMILVTCVTMLLIAVIISQSCMVLLINTHIQLLLRLYILPSVAMLCTMLWCLCFAMLRVWGARNRHCVSVHAATSQMDADSITCMSLSATSSEQLTSAEGLATATKPTQLNPQQPVANARHVAVHHVMSSHPPVADAAAAAANALNDQKTHATPAERDLPNAASLCMSALVAAARKQHRIGSSAALYKSSTVHCTCGIKVCGQLLNASASLLQLFEVCLHQV